mmetsp:Transcript_19482/g.47892  ORF Transcript_19482/g.47892 Transcript_19482/m.47892 type:complete len:279 (+) Transcript_19482:41-877(+)
MALMAFAAAWAALVDAADERDVDLVVVGAFVVMMVVYWSYGGALAALELYAPHVLERFAPKYQPTRPLRVQRTAYNPSMRALIQNVLINQCLVVVPGMWFMSRVCERAQPYVPWRIGVHVTRELPPLWDTLARMAVAAVLVEVFFFTSHYVLHIGPLYRLVHKRHHEFHAPTALAAVYAHPIEALFGNTFAVIGPAWLVGVHALPFLLGVAYGWASTCTGHAGLSLPWSRGKDFHDWHHEYNTGNYGTLQIMDALFGTDRRYREQKRAQRQATKTKAR